jgi:hypothetical protein
VVRELIDHGEVSPVWLGLDLQDLDSGLAAALELPSGARGAIVSRVRGNSPAERAGVKRGDVITQVDGQPLESARGFFERLERRTAGQQLSLTALRNGETRKVAVRAEQIPEGYVATLVNELLGLTLEPAPRGGFAVSGVRTGSHAAQIGLRRGDVLLAIGGRGLTDPEALRRAVLALRACRARCSWLRVGAADTMSPSRSRVVSAWPMNPGTQATSQTRSTSLGARARSEPWSRPANRRRGKSESEMRTSRKIGVVLGVVAVALLASGALRIHVSWLDNNAYAIDLFGKGNPTRPARSRPTRRSPSGSRARASSRSSRAVSRTRSPTSPKPARPAS